MAIYEIDSFNGAVAYTSEVITVSTAVVTPTAAKIQTVEYLGGTNSGTGQAFTRTRRASMAVMTVESNPIRFLVTGGSPNSTTGCQGAANDQIIIKGVEHVANLKMIRSGGSDATVQITYFRTS